MVAARKAAVVAGMRSTPRDILDRLLTLSTSFALEDEITPAQAWERMRGWMGGRGPQLYESEGGAADWWREVVRRMVGRLAGVVKCYG